MRRTASLLLAPVLMAAGCVTPQQGAPLQLPYLAMFKPPPPGKETILLTAAGTQYLRIDNHCVLMGNPQAGYSLPIFYPRTTVGRDGRGLYVQDAQNGRKFRNGDKVKIGGGSSPFKGRDLDQWLVRPIPDVCLARTGGSAASVNPGMKRA